MHTPGHVGIGFATAVPVAFALGDAGLGHLALPATALLVGLSPLPDVDEFLPVVAHRGATHSIPFALLVGACLASLGWVGGPGLGATRPVLAALGLLVGVLAMGLHVLADLLTPMGVYAAWPLSRERRSLNVVRSADPQANRSLLAVGLLGWLLTVPVFVGL